MAKVRCLAEEDALYLWLIIHEVYLIRPYKGLLWVKAAAKLLNILRRWGCLYLMQGRMKDRRVICQ